MRTHTKFFSFSKLANVDGATTVVRIAMVWNDLAIANSSLGYFKRLPPKTLNHIRQGAPLYFVRMSCGHLREGLRAIKEVKASPRLAELVKGCDPHAQSAFAALCECLPNGGNYADFERYVKPVRNKTAFHYDSDQVEWALRFRAKHHSRTPGSMTIGEDIHSTRFEFADVVLDTVTCRNLWSIPMSADVQVEADRIAEWAFNRTLEFLDFGGDFVSRYLRKYAPL
jgi:hypothetical protein